MFMNKKCLMQAKVIFVPFVVATATVGVLTFAAIPLHYRKCFTHFGLTVGEKLSLVHSKQMYCCAVYLQSRLNNHCLLQYM